MTQDAILSPLISAIADAVVERLASASSAVQRVEQDDRLNYTVKHAAEVVDMSRTHLLRQIQEGRCGSIMIGSQRYVTREQLLRWLRSLEWGQSQPVVAEEPVRTRRRRAS